MPARSEVSLRPPAQVMRLARLGAFHQTRLSFMRAFLRQVKRDAWHVERTHWAIGVKGEGLAIYQVFTGERYYSLVCFSHQLPDHLRTDRVIAEQWDATFVLFDGIPSTDDIERLRVNTPKQEAGRFLETDLILSRANRSVRLFDHVECSLAKGVQPSAEEIKSVGYLMRTTAVYGNGKFGIADRDRIAARAEFRCAFRAEMLTVWLIRAFTVDLVEALAKHRNPEAVRLDVSLRRLFGVGNSTGLGMAPFLVRHPALLSRWIEARETALMRVRRLPEATPPQRSSFASSLDHFIATLSHWSTADEVQTQRIETLRTELPGLRERFSALIEEPFGWDSIYRWAEDNLSLEGQELTVSLLIEPHGELVDDLADIMEADETQTFAINGRMPVATLGALVERYYPWALSRDYASGPEQARFWYYSEEKLEPRLGERDCEPGVDLELPLAIGRDIEALYEQLRDCEPTHTTAAFLLKYPQHRHVVRRLQFVAGQPYGEIQENLIHATMRPIDMLRCKLSFFGASRFDPRSDRWVRITMFQGAPYPDELDRLPADQWAFFPLGAAR